ncbi:MAG: hypothetical protein QF619_12225 [Candidatus Binatia bacterium]|nr:hypothetical protein [Candidatus Binatia bacterium]
MTENTTPPDFFPNTLDRFADIERLVSKIYFRFSHLFLHQSELRDFWWQMAIDEEQHACILTTCKAIIENYEDVAVDPFIDQDKAAEIEETLQSYLEKGTQSIAVEEAFRIALDIENSELDSIYRRLLESCGPKVAKTMENVGVPASVQRRKLASAVLCFARDPELRASVEGL